MEYCDARGVTRILTMPGAALCTGFLGTLTVRRLPGFDFMSRRIMLQQHPGYASVVVSPDTPPNKDTIVNVTVISTFGTDQLKQDLLGGEVLAMSRTFMLKKGSTAPITLMMTHGGTRGGVLRNMVAGAAVVRFFVSDAASNYNGIGSGSSDVAASTFAVDVMPGFISNVQDTLRRTLQSGQVFALSITLDHPTTEPINVTFTSSAPSLASVSPAVILVPRGATGPFILNVTHMGTQGTASLSISVLNGTGNYANVVAQDYLTLDLLPGIALPSLTPAGAFLVQHQNGIAHVPIGLDTRPTADVFVSIMSADPDVATVTREVTFRASSWVAGAAGYQTVMLRWESPGITTLLFEARSPAGNYQGVRREHVTVYAKLPINVTRSQATVQKGGTIDVAIALPQNPTSDVTLSFTAHPPGVVATGPPITLRVNQSRTVTTDIVHVTRGSATVRILASGGQYDGVSYDLPVTAKPGFLTSQPTVVLTSCFSNPVCFAVVTVVPEEPLTADIAVSISSSDTSVALVQPTFAHLTRNASSVSLNISYVAPGTACLSFAATGVGNYDGVHSGGVDVTAVPDFSAGSHVMKVRFSIHTLRCTPPINTHAPLIQDHSHPVLHLYAQQFP
jgi:hypothetical protein